MLCGQANMQLGYLIIADQLSPEPIIRIPTLELLSFYLASLVTK